MRGRRCNASERILLLSNKESIIACQGPHTRGCPTGKERSGEESLLHRQETQLAALGRSLRSLYTTRQEGSATRKDLASSHDQGMKHKGD